MKINGLKDLDHYILHRDDIVIFHVKDKQGKFVNLKYVVCSDFLRNTRNKPGVCLNDKIFNVLELDPHEFCSKYYGYETNNGIWPCCKKWDFKAITNVVKALYTLIDSINMSESISSCCPAIEECKKQEFEIINYVKHKTIRTIKQDNNSKLKRI